MTENPQTEREKLADAIDPRKNPESVDAFGWMKVSVTNLLPASDALRASRPTDAHKAVAEKIARFCFGEVDETDIAEITALLAADLPGGFVMTEEEHSKIEFAGRFLRMGNGTATGPDQIIGDLLAIITRATTPGSGWRDIATAPKGLKLIAGYWNELGKWRTITACYYESGTLESYNDTAEDGFASEGWYEESETHDEIMPCTTPTHWQPLPTPPTATGGGA